MQTVLLHQTDSPAESMLAFPRAGAEVCGRYRVIRMLGRGGMAAVFEAENVELGGRVALKILDPDLARNHPAMVDRFLREARITAQMVHPSVVRVYDAGWSVDRGRSLPFIAMELLDGRTLEELVGKGPLAVSRAILIADQVLSVLETAHAVGVVHRDLKPDNIRVMEGDRVKVLDFGISKPLRSALALTVDGCVLGTPGFMAPEQLHEPREVDARADLFATGALLYVMLTGRLPFEGDPVRALLARRSDDHGASTPLRARRPDVPASLAHVVERAMRLDRTERWESAAAMRAALASANPSSIGEDPTAPADISSCREVTRPVCRVAVTQRLPEPTLPQWPRPSLCSATTERIHLKPRTSAAAWAALAATTAVAGLIGALAMRALLPQAVRPAETILPSPPRPTIPLIPRVRPPEVVYRDRPEASSATGRQCRFQALVGTTGARVTLDGMATHGSVVDVPGECGSIRTLRVEAPGHRPLERAIEAGAPLVSVELESIPRRPLTRRSAPIGEDRVRLMANPFRFLDGLPAGLDPADDRHARAHAAGIRDATEPQLVWGDPR